MRLYIIRHGDPDYAKNDITHYGHEEARALSKKMAKEDLDYIYSSPYGRAVSTAKYTAEATGKSIEILDWTHELQLPFPEGPREGCWMVWDMSPEELYQDGLIYDINNYTSPRYGNCENIKTEFERIKMSSDDFLAKHGYKREGNLYRVTKSNTDKIAIFCHLGFELALLSHLLNIPLCNMWNSFWLAPTSVTTLVFDQRMGSELASPRILTIGDTSHLYAEGVEVRPRGLACSYY